ncbi:MAG: hypothetical protein WCG48_01515 [Candidatus Berkelbacteria bacterium]
MRNLMAMLTLVLSLVLVYFLVGCSGGTNDPGPGMISQLNLVLDGAVLPAPINGLRVGNRIRMSVTDNNGNLLPCSYKITAPNGTITDSNEWDLTLPGEWQIEALEIKEEGHSGINIVFHVAP